MHTVISVGLGFTKLYDTPTVTIPLEYIDAYKN
jgi:hypothetical protein